MDRERFFDAARTPLFGGKLTKKQVAGMTAILDGWDAFGGTDPKRLAYVLATAFHETATRMEPVIETRRPDEETNPSVETAIARLESSWKRGRMPWVKSPYWRKDSDGLSWLGRGFPQLTFRRNYLKAEVELKVPLTKNPDLALELAIAVPIMIEGMAEGWFTGKRLSDYFAADKADWRNARKIINGLESADKVAGYAKAFYADILTAA